MDGLTRLKHLIQEQQDKPLIRIVTYLLQLEDMSEKYQNEEKDLKQMISFLRDKAKEFQINNIAIIEDQTVFDWSVEYWSKSNEELGLNKKNVIPSATVSKVTKPKVEEPGREQLSLELG